MKRKIRVLVWNEYRQEKTEPAVKAVYPSGIHDVIAESLAKEEILEVGTAVLDDPNHGLTEEKLKDTDVLIWWGHKAHKEVNEKIVDIVVEEVLGGMGLIVLHSGHFSKVFTRLMGTNCSLRFREAGERERLWNIAPGHCITQGIDDYFELPRTEMYGERFDIPDPDQIIFLSWFEGGEVFRSGCTWKRGNGKIFYFQPGHETYPIYYDENVMRVIKNAVLWSQRRIRRSTLGAVKVDSPLEPID